jgi:hypothetical protein
MGMYRAEQTGAMAMQFPVGGTKERRIGTGH